MVLGGLILLAMCLAGSFPKMVYFLYTISVAGLIGVISQFASSNFLPPPILSLATSILFLVATRELHRSLQNPKPAPQENFETL